MKTFTLLAFASAVTALSGVSIDGHTYNLMKRHRQMAERQQSIRPRAGPTRRGFARVVKRKTPGAGDATTQPGNVAAGTFGADQGCAVWHTVSDGEVCLGLIDKSSAAFTMAQFLKFNPSLNSDCSNLETGTAYCVDSVAGAASAVKEATVTPAATTPRVAAVQTNDSADVEEEDCEDSEETSEPAASTTDDSESEDCEEETEAVDPEPDAEDCEEEDNSVTETSDSSDPSTDDDDSATISVKVGKKPADKSKESTASSDDTTESSEESPDDSSKKTSSKSSSSTANVNLEFSGIATYYEQNGNAGNCGQVNPDSAAIVALYTPQYENGANCGKKVKLVNKANGNSIVATVADSCPSCQTLGNIDLSSSVFSSLSDGNMGLGILDVEWGYI